MATPRKIDIYLGDNDKIGKVEYRCFGCGDEICFHYSAKYSEKDVEKIIRRKGWSRREFAYMADPFFCDWRCMWESEASKKAEQFWRKKNGLSL